MDHEAAFKKKVFLVIMDYSLPVYHETQFSSYAMWANYISKSLRANNISLVSRDINKMVTKCNKFFGFKEDEMATYILEFFLYAEYKNSYEVIRLIRELYGGYVSIK